MPYVVDKQSMKEELERQNYSYNMRNTFAQMYGSAGLSAQKQSQELAYDYSSALGQAYAASTQNEQNILSSPYGEGYQEKWLQDNMSQLEDAYKSFESNYQSHLLGIGQNLESSSEAISKYETAFEKELDNEAENMALYYQSLYDYLPALREHYLNSADTDKFITDSVLSQYLVNGELKSSEELRKDFRNITPKGLDFIDQMLNYEASTDPENGYSFNDWLREQSLDSGSAYKNLYDWSVSETNFADYGDVNKYGKYTNAATFKVLSGLASDDENYTFVERFSRMNKDEVDKIYNTLNTEVQQLERYIHKGEYGKATEYTVNSLKQLKVVANKLGVSDESLDWDELIQNAKVYLETENLKDIVKDERKDKAKLAGKYIAATLSGLGNHELGVTLSNMVNEAKTISDGRKEDAKSAADASKKLYEQALAQLVVLSQKQREDYKNNI